MLSETENQDVEIFASSKPTKESSDLSDSSERSTKKSLSIIIPCYNEELGIIYLKEQIDPIILKLQETYDLELLFVDDGSRDKTLELLENTFGHRDYVKIIPHKVNQNLGQAIRTGFEAACGDIIVTMDSDCTYSPKGIFEMLEMLDDETDIVTASPYHPKGGVLNVPKYRIFLSKCITTIYKILTFSRIHTFTALFRVQKKHIAKKIPFISNDFLATAELIIYPLLIGFKVKEYPDVLNVRKYGQSKMRLLQVIRSHFFFICKLTWMRISGQFGIMRKACGPETVDQKNC
ncbi:glycosyltransferase family 2 protein [archaeon]|nr:glycosyltransferase family 2 protein [archaeon]